MLDGLLGMACPVQHSMEVITCTTMASEALREIELCACCCTGQNAASALQVAELVVEALSYGVRLTP